MKSFSTFLIEKIITAYRAEGSKRGIKTDALRGGIYFYPKKESADLWAGNIGTVVTKKIDISNASVQEVYEGDLVDDGSGVVIRKEPNPPHEIIEIVVFDKKKIVGN